MDVFKRPAAFFIYIVFPFLFGCAGSEPTQPEMYTVRIEGRVFNSVSYNDILSQNTAVKSAAVDIYRIDITGNKKVNVNSAVTNSEGKFIIETEFEGTREYLVVAHKDEKTWKAVVKAAVENEVTIFIQPLTDESTAEAEVYLAAGMKYNIPYYDISLLVTGQTGELILENAGYADLAADIINSAVQSRLNTFSHEYFGVNNEKYSLFLSEGEEIQSKYARDLHFAKTDYAVKTLTTVYNESFIDAFLSTGITNDKVLKILEIYYRVLVNPDYDNHELKSEIRKRASLLKAYIMSSSFSSDLQNLNGGRKVREVNSAGESLIKSINSTNDYKKIKNYFKNYQEVVLDNLIKVSGMSSTLKNSIEMRINPNLENLNSNLELGSEPYIIVDSFIKYYTSASAEVKSLLKNTYSDNSDSIAEMMIMLYINF
jgi:hypothetical protein